MNATKVVILNNRSVLMHIVEHLLASQEEIELGIVPLEDPNLNETLLAISPNAILIDEGDLQGRCCLVRSLLSSLPGTALISLDLDHPVINVYSKCEIAQSDPQGLFAAIQGTRDWHLPADECGLGRGERCSTASHGERDRQR